MRLGLAADHGGFELKEQLKEELKTLGHEVVDFGAHEYDPQDDYPDLVGPLARAVAQGEVERGVAICGSGVGACVAANKVPGVRGALITDPYSARQGAASVQPAQGPRPIGNSIERLNAISRLYPLMIAGVSDDSSFTGIRTMLSTLPW